MVLTVREQQVSSRGISARQTGVRDGNAFGVNVAQAGQRLGKTGAFIGTQITNEQIAENEKQNKMDALAIATEAERQAKDILFNPDKGIFTQKGGLARGAQGRFEKQYDKIEQQLKSTIRNNPQLSEFASLKLKDIRSSLSSQVEKHEFNEIQNFNQGVLASRAQLRLEDTVLNYNDSERFEQNLRDVQSTLIDQQKTQGWDKATYDLKKTEATSAMVTARIDRMLADGSPTDVVAAYEFLQQQQEKGRLNATDIVNYQKSFESLMPQAKAEIAFNNMLSTEYTDIVEGDLVFDALLQQESGKRQFDSNGQPLKSSAGAIGIAQVMPQTAPEAARLAGLEFDEERYKNDPEYNRALGQAYFNARQQKWGSTPLALAAYNAGDGRVQEWIEKYGDPRNGEISMQEWIARIPFKETRNYVQNITANVRQANNNAIPEKSILQVADSITDFDERKAFVKYAEEYNKLRDTAKKNEKKELQDQIGEILAQNNGDYTKVPKDLQARAARLDIDITQYDGVSDVPTMVKLNAMTASQLASTDLEQYRDRLTFADYQAFVKKQDDLQSPDNKYTQDIIDQTVEYYFRNNVDNDVQDEKNKLKIAQYKTFITNGIQQRKTNGETITPAVVEEVAKLYFRQNKNMVNFDSSKLTEKERTQIEQSIRLAGKPVTEANMADTYMLGVTTGIFKPDVDGNAWIPDFNFNRGF